MAFILNWLCYTVLLILIHKGDLLTPKPISKDVPLPENVTNIPNPSGDLNKIPYEFNRIKELDKTARWPPNNIEKYIVARPPVLWNKKSLCQIKYNALMKLYRIALGKPAFLNPYKNVRFIHSRLPPIFDDIPYRYINSLHVPKVLHPYEQFRNIPYNFKNFLHPYKISPQRYKDFRDHSEYLRPYQSSLNIPQKEKDESEIVDPDKLRKYRDLIVNSELLHPYTRYPNMPQKYKVLIDESEFLPPYERSPIIPHSQQYLVDKAEFLQPYKTTQNIPIPLEELHDSSEYDDNNFNKLKLPSDWSNQNDYNNKRLAQRHHVINKLGSTTHILKNPVGSGIPIGGAMIPPSVTIGGIGYKPANIVPIKYHMMLAPILNQLKTVTFYGPIQLDPRILMEFIYFLAQLDSNNLRISHISTNLWKFFGHNHDLRKVIQILYASPFFNSPASIEKINAIQKMITYLPKLTQGLAQISDLSPDLLSLILRLNFWPEFLPPLPLGLLQKFINDASTLDLDLQKIPEILIQFLQNTPTGVIEPIISKLASNKPNINPNIILQLIELLKKKQLGNITPELELFLNKLKNNSFPIIPPSIKLELKTFILDIINKNKMNIISPNLLEFIIKHRDIHTHIDTIFKEENIPKSEINPQIITQLIELEKDSKTHIPIKNVPEPLINLILKLKGVNNLEKPVLETIKERNPSKLISALLQLTMKYGHPNIVPLHIKYWLLTLPNGKDLIKYLKTPGDIDCRHDNNNKVECTKKIKGVVPPNIITELVNLINGIIKNNRMSEISPNLLEFITKYPDLQKIIVPIFKKENISNSKITPQSIIDLLHFIKKSKNNEPIKEIPDGLRDLVLNLKGNERTLKIILDWLKSNKPADMMQIFLQTIKENGGKIIPQFLREWILLLPNGKDVIKYLQRPGEIDCNRKPDGNAVCYKTLITTTPPKIMENPRDELKKFIFEISNNKKLIDLSSNLMQFILKYPDVEKIITEIFQTNNISTTEVNPQMIIELLKLIILVKNKADIREIPPSVLSLVTKLTGAESLSNILLNWVNTNKQPDMMQIFLQLIKENGGKDIPENLRLWLLSLPNGAKIIEFLRLPGKIECKQKTDGHVKCIKTVHN